MDNYNKLVRDKIPAIIENSGRTAKYHVLPEKEYLTALDKKLFEEVEEYQADKSLEEMADVLEVLYAICKARGYSVEELEGKRVEKFRERGGFDKKIFLEYAKEEG